MTKKYLLVCVGFFILMLGLGWFIRFDAASNFDLWQDESMSFAFANSNSFADLFWQTPHYTDIHHPPYYYLLLKAWIGYFPATEVSIRLLSLIFFPATFVVFYWLGRKKFSKEAGLIMAGLFSVHPLLANLGYQARMYSVSLFFGTLGIFFFLELEKGKKIDLFLTSFFFSLCIYFDYLGLWLFPAIGLVCLVSLIERNWKKFAIYLKLFFAILVMTWFQLGHLFSYIENDLMHGPGSVPIDHFGVNWCMAQFAKLLGIYFETYGLGQFIFSFGVIIFTFHFIYKGIRVKKMKSVVWLLFGYLIGPLLFSILIQPMFLSRNVSLASIMFIIILTATAMGKRKKTAQSVLSLIFILTILIGWAKQSLEFNGFELQVGVEARTRDFAISDGSLFLLPGLSREIFQGYYFQIQEVPNKKIFEVDGTNIEQVIGNKSLKKYFLFPYNCVENDQCKVLLKKIDEYCNENSSCIAKETH